MTAKPVYLVEIMFPFDVNLLFLFSMLIKRIFQQLEKQLLCNRLSLNWQHCTGLIVYQFIMMKKWTFLWWISGLKNTKQDFAKHERLLFFMTILGVSWVQQCWLWTPFTEDHLGNVCPATRRFPCVPSGMTSALGWRWRSWTPTQSCRAKSTGLLLSSKLQVQIFVFLMKR